MLALRNGGKTNRRNFGIAALEPAQDEWFIGQSESCPAFVQPPISRIPTKTVMGLGDGASNIAIGRVSLPRCTGKGCVKR